MLAIITIVLTIQSRQKWLYVLCYTDSSFTFGWMHRGSFHTKKHPLHDRVARYLAFKCLPFNSFIFSNTCLASQIIQPMHFLVNFICLMRSSCHFSIWSIPTRCLPLFIWSNSQRKFSHGSTRYRENWHPKTIFQRNAVQKTRGIQMLLSLSHRNRMQWCLAHITRQRAKNSNLFCLYMQHLMKLLWHQKKEVTLRRLSQNYHQTCLWEISDSQPPRPLTWCRQ